MGGSFVLSKAEHYRHLAPGIEVRQRLAQGLKLHAQILENRSAGTPGRSLSTPVSPLNWARSVLCGGRFSNERPYRDPVSLRGQ
jgi:hypothetical protein